MVHFAQMQFSLQCFPVGTLIRLQPAGSWFCATKILPSRLGYYFCCCGQRQGTLILLKEMFNPFLQEDFSHYILLIKSLLSRSRNWVLFAGVTLRKGAIEEKRSADS